MKTLTDIEEIENYLFGKLDTPSKLVFEAKMLIDPALQADVKSQRRLYSLVKAAGRRRIKSEIEQIHSRLFSDPKKQNFQSSIYNLFT